MVNMKSGMFTSLTGEWETPKELFDELNNKFNFTLDACATSKNKKIENYLSPEENALEQEWYGRVWMNPPYGREIKKWIAKAYKESKENADLVVCLVPSRTDTKWWHDYCMKGEIWFIKGRLKFGNSKNSAPFPSAIVIFK